MARLDIRPVASQTAESGWSHTLILSDTPHAINDTTSPTWIVSISLSGENASEHGLELLEAISTSYQTIEFKTPESLYQILNQQCERLPEISLAALCLTAHQAVAMGRGEFRISVRREEREVIIVSGKDREWHAIEGAWTESDRWWLIVGDADQLDLSNILTHTNLELAAETLHGEMSSLPSLALASALIYLSPSTSEVPSSSFIEPLPITDPLPLGPPEAKIAKRRQIMLIGWVILILLVASVWIGSKARVEKQLATKYQTLETQVTESLAAATALRAVDQVKARLELRSIGDKVSQSESTFKPYKTWYDQWSALNATVSAAYQALAGEAVIDNPPPWFSLSVLKPNFVGSALGISGDNLVVLDKQTSTLVKLGISSKRSDILTGGAALENPTHLAISGTRAIVHTDKGIIDVSLSRKSISTIVENDPTWQTIGGIALFNGNIYVVDSAAGEIWRYPGLTSGVGEKQKWLGSGVSLSATDIADMAVDGDLWLLTRTGSIKRYRRGAPLNFSFSGFDIPLSNQTASLSVSLDSDMVAILDNGNARIVGFTKQGTYIKQIKWTGLANAEAIALSTDTNTVFVLSGGNIYALTW